MAAPWTEFDLNSLPDVPDIPASIVASGLSDAPLTTLVEIAMQRLVQSGVPIDRMMSASASCTRCSTA